MRIAGPLVAGVFLLAVALQASAQPVVLTFEGLPNFQAVGEHYDGGGGGNLGVTFTGVAQALLTVAVEDRQLFKNQPSGVTVVALGAAASATPVATMIRDGGFTRITLHYASSYYAEVEFLAGGVPLVPIGSTTTRIGLPPNNISGIPAYDDCSDIPPEATYCNWTQVTFSFAGAVTSVSFFASRTHEILFDDLTITPVSQPGEPLIPPDDPPPADGDADRLRPTRGSCSSA